MPAIGEFLCPECGGVANVCFTTVNPENVNILPGRQHPATPGAWSSWRPGCTHVMIELICQGPADPWVPDDDPLWDHAGYTVIDILATGYQPIGLN